MKCTTFALVSEMWFSPFFWISIEYEIFGEGSHISTNQKRENSAFSPLIG